jgi:hypothetical protein
VFLGLCKWTSFALPLQPGKSPAPESTQLKGLKKMNPSSTSQLNFGNYFAFYFLEIETRTVRNQVFGIMFTFIKYFMSEGRMRKSGTEVM